MSNESSEKRRPTGLGLSRRECFGLPLLALTAGSAWSKNSFSPVATTGLQAGNDYATVSSKAGAVRGFIRRKTFSFKGIPYGESTGGANRFAEPLPRKPWSGVRSCLSYGPVCPQSTERSLGGDEANFLVPVEQGFQSEDCLRLNVWSPAIDTGAKLSVMVFLHGGRYTTGSSQSLLAYDGENLAQRHQVVVVTLNHRLGAFGFLDLAHRGADHVLTGNLGMLDIVLALRWVQENIRAFGGDPQRVTVFGQSGGAGKVAALLAMPKAAGLFHRAIAQSGPVLKLREPAASQAMADALLQSLGQKNFNFVQLQALEPRLLLKASDQVLSRYEGPIFSPDLSTGHDTVGWAPVVDGKVLIAHPFSPPALRLSADVPLMVGTTLNEIGNSIDEPRGKELTEQALRGRVKETFGEKAGGVIEAFRRDTPHATPAELWSRIASAPVRQMAIEQCARKSALGAAHSYLYWFQWQTPVLDGRPGAFHTSELPFVFDNSERCDSITGGGLGPQRLADQMAGAWTAFARSGDPNGSGLAMWPAYDSARGATMIFDTRCESKDSPDRGELAALADTATKP